MTNLALPTDEITFWNGVAAERWVQHQAALDARIAVYGHAAIRALAPRAGERVLDVGCGCGDTVLALAEAVGAGGHVTGLDVSERMLGRAKERAAGRANVDLAHADAAKWRASAKYDALVSRFGVMFFSDPVAAFANLRDALVENGRLAFACWRPLPENPWAFVPLSATLTVAPAPPAPPAPPSPDAPGPFSFASPERVKDVLGRAGFTAIALEPFTAPMLLGETLDAAVQYATEMGPSSRLLTELPPDEVTRAHAAIRAALEPHGPRVALDGAVWIVTAQRG